MSVGRIDAHVESAVEYTTRATNDTKKALEYQTKARRKKIMIMVCLIIAGTIGTYMAGRWLELFWTSLHIIISLVNTSISRPVQYLQHKANEQTTYLSWLSNVQCANLPVQMKNEDWQWQAPTCFTQLSLTLTHPWSMKHVCINIMIFRKVYLWCEVCRMT